MFRNSALTTLVSITMLQFFVSADEAPALPIDKKEVALALPPDQVNVKAAPLRGIFITSKREDIIAKGRPKTKGVEFKDFMFPQDEGGLKTVLEPFLGKPQSPQLLADIKEALLKYLKKVQHPTARVLFPQQTAANGVIQILIGTYTLGKTTFSGNQHYSDAYLSRYIHVSPGKEISEDTLLNDFSWINRNPFQHLGVKYVPSATPGVMDLQVAVKDRSPLRYYVRGSDTGSDSSGNLRYAAGFSWGNAFWLGDLLTYEYGTSNAVKRVQGHKINYTSFLPWRHILLLFGTFNVCKPNIPRTTSKSLNYQTKLRYTIPFKPLYTALGQDFTFGIDFKHSQNRSFSLGPKDKPVPKPKTKFKAINYSQFYIAYTFSDTLGQHSLSMSMETTFSPFVILDHQSHKNFNANRKNLRQRYAYALFTAGDTYYFPKGFQLAVLLRFQRAFSTIPSTELFGLGGSTTVRGYKQSVLNTDNGAQVSTEFRLPAFSFFPKIKDKFIFLGFVDYGFGNNFFRDPAKGKTPRDKASQYLLGAGPGFRYNINPYLQAAVDYGFRLHDMYSRNKDEKRLRGGYGRWHINILMSY